MSTEPLHLVSNYLWRTEKRESRELSIDLCWSGQESFVPATSCHHWLMHYPVNRHTLICTLNLVGAQSRPTQNVCQWHIDYYELKLLKKQQTQEGHSDPPVSLKTGNKAFVWKVHSLSLSHERMYQPASRGRRDTLIDKEREFVPRREKPI